MAGKLGNLLKQQLAPVYNHFRISPLVRAVKRERLTYLSSEKLYRLEAAVGRALDCGTTGSVTEFGIALGGSAIILATIARRHERTFHGFDVWYDPGSFCGRSSAQRRFETIDSVTRKASAAMSITDTGRIYNEVCKSFQSHAVLVYGLTVQLHRGLFSDTLPALPTQRIAAAHVDCDWYEPVKLCLNQNTKAIRQGHYHCTG